MSTQPQRTPVANVGFATTQWSVILHAADDVSGASPGALEALCSIYWPPLYAYARRDGLSPQDAQDAVQDFLHRLLHGNGLASVSPDKGRFRTFLLVALKNFLISRARKEQAIKRGGAADRLCLDTNNAEALCESELADQMSPDKAFDRRWAHTIMTLALDRLRDEHKSIQQARVFAALQPVLSEGGRVENQAALATELGVTPGALATAATRLRQRYREFIEAEVRRTVDKPADVQEELRALRTAWT